MDNSILAIIKGFTHCTVRTSVGLLRATIFEVILQALAHADFDYRCKLQRPARPF